MDYRFTLAAVAVLAMATGAAAQQKLDLSLDPDTPDQVAATPKCPMPVNDFVVLDENGAEYGSVRGSQSRGAAHLNGTIDGTPVNYRSNWVCDDDYTTVFSADTGNGGPNTVFLIKYDDGSLGLEFDYEDGTAGFIGLLVPR